MLSLVQPSLDPFAGLRSERLERTFRVMVFVLLSDGAKEPDLLSITTAPLTKEQMNLQPDALNQPQPAIQRFRLQTCGLPASG